MKFSNKSYLNFLDFLYKRYFGTKMIRHCVRAFPTLFGAILSRPKQQLLIWEECSICTQSASYRMLLMTRVNNLIEFPCTSLLIVLALSKWILVATSTWRPKFIHTRKKFVSLLLEQNTASDIPFGDDDCLIQWLHPRYSNCSVESRNHLGPRVIPSKVL